MCSLRRQLEKFHLTSKIDLAPQQKLYEKAVSFSLTDANTPVIGHLCAAILRHTQGYTPTGQLQRWGDNHDISVQYPNAFSSWMLEVACLELPNTDVFRFIAWLEEFPPLDQLLNCPTFYEEGREFEHDKEWNVEPGLLYKTTAAPANIPAPPDLSRFGENGDIMDDGNLTLQEFVALLNKECNRSRSRSISH
jgi:hypothetical protein